MESEARPLAVVTGANRGIGKEVARQLARPSLRLLKPPLALEPFATSMLWHARSDADPGCRWLRDMLLRAGAKTSATAKR